MSCKNSKFNYPETKKSDQVDNYFGVEINDPYRWLEDENSDDTKIWVEAQNQITYEYLSKIPYREKIKLRLTEIFNFPKTSSPEFILIEESKML